MIDKVEKILAFINERIEWNNKMMKRDPKPSDIGRIEEAKCIRRFIDSLQEEPVCEELEEAATKYAQDKYMPVQTSQAFKAGANWQKEQMIANSTDATIGLPYENKDGGYTHLVDVSRPLPIGDNKIAIIF